MHKDHIRTGAYLKDTKRRRLYEVIGREPNKVTMVDANTDCDDPTVEPVTWRISDAETRLELIEPAPDSASIATEEEWGRTG